ncbi:hypothetical protein [Bordetella sp. LUAb4]|uniref:hypothetical protein n=1 Tax=Bordetella sp. LUAb4 TaxID=2843195 RepID=UPI001E2B7BA2|nr:hypothetical protein [Bordetella sp. LUAb4]
MRTNPVSKLRSRARPDAADALSRLVSVETVLPTLATKSDLLALKIELKSEFHEAQSKSSADFHTWKLESKSDVLSLKADMSGLESRLIRWMAGMGIAGLAMVFSFMNLHLSRIDAKLQPYVAVAPVAVGAGGTAQEPGGLPSNR